MPSIFFKQEVVKIKTRTKIRGKRSCTTCYELDAKLQKTTSDALYHRAQIFLLRHTSEDTTQNRHTQTEHQCERDIRSHEAMAVEPGWFGLD